MWVIGIRGQGLDVRFYSLKLGIRVWESEVVEVKVSDLIRTLKDPVLHIVYSKLFFSYFASSFVSLVLALSHSLAEDHSTPLPSPDVWRQPNPKPPHLQGTGHHHT